MTLRFRLNRLGLRGVSRFGGGGRRSFRGKNLFILIEEAAALRAMVAVGADRHLLAVAHFGAGTGGLAGAPHGAAVGTELHDRLPLPSSGGGIDRADGAE